MAELSKGGWSRIAFTGFASTRPSALSRGTASGGSGFTFFRMRSRASSTGSSAMVFTPR